MTDERFEPAIAGDEVDPEAERIVSEIEVTRTRMGGTIDEIGHRLQPQTIAGQAREQLREATVGRVERLMDDAGRTAQQTGNNLIDTIRENPVPAALAALGIGWLAFRAREQQPYRYTSGARYDSGRTDPMHATRQAVDRAAVGVQDAADQAAARAQHLGGDMQSAAQLAVEQTEQTVQQAQWQAQASIGQAQRQFDRTLHENPLALGALAMGVGAAVALAIPETRRERELLGEQRDRLFGQAQAAASEALDQVEEKAADVSEQLRGEA